MKIGIVCPYNLFRHGGVQETVFEHQQHLQARGHDVLIISPRPRAYKGDVPKDVRLIGVSTDLNYPFRTKADFSVQVGQREMKELLKREHFDILHFHEPWVPMFPRQLLNISHSINVATFHAKLPEKVLFKTIGKAIKPYTRSVIEDLDFIAAASEPGSHYISELIGRQVPIIFNGINLKRFNPDNAKPLKQYDDGLKTIVYINRLEKRKGPDLLLKAYRELVKSRDDTRLLIASDGDMRPKLEEYVAYHQLPRVEFLGFVDLETKISLYKSADLYVAPSPYGEGFGIVLLEAMSMRAPLLAGDNVGYRSALGERADLYVADPNQPKVFAKRMAEILDDAKLRQYYVAWSRDYAAQFDYEKIVVQYEQIYHELIERKRSRQ